MAATMAALRPAMVCAVKLLMLAGVIPATALADKASTHAGLIQDQLIAIAAVCAAVRLPTAAGESKSACCSPAICWGVMAVILLADSAAVVVLLNSLMPASGIAAKAAGDSALSVAILIPPHWLTVTAATWVGDNAAAAAGESKSTLSAAICCVVMAATMAALRPPVVCAVKLLMLAGVIPATALADKASTHAGLIQDQLIAIAAVCAAVRLPTAAGESISACCSPAICWGVMAVILLADSAAVVVLLNSLMPASGIAAKAAGDSALSVAILIPPHWLTVTAATWVGDNAVAAAGESKSTLSAAICCVVMAATMAALRPPVVCAVKLLMLAGVIPATALADKASTHAGLIQDQLIVIAAACAAVRLPTAAGESKSACCSPAICWGVMAAIMLADSAAVVVLLNSLMPASGIAAKAAGDSALSVAILIPPHWLTVTAATWVGDSAAAAAGESKSTLSAAICCVVMAATMAALRPPVVCAVILPMPASGIPATALADKASTHAELIQYQLVEIAAACTAVRLPTAAGESISACCSPAICWSVMAAIALADSAAVVVPLNSLMPASGIAAKAAGDSALSIAALIPPHWLTVTAVTWVGVSAAAAAGESALNHDELRLFQSLPLMAAT